MHELTRTDARRIAVRAQLFDAQRPSGLMDVVQHLTMLKVDPVSAVAPNADLVAWSRLGSTYSPIELHAALDMRWLVELHAAIRPAEDITLFRAQMDEWPGRPPLRPWQESIRDWVAANDACRRDILHRIEASGPLTVRELPDTCAVPWRSTGWTNERNVSRLLEFMVSRGEVALSGRRGTDRLWDLADRVYPDEPAVPYDDALRIRAERRLAALGIARATGTELPGPEQVTVGEVGEPAVVDGVRGTWRVDPAQLGQDFTGRAALVSPLDRLVFDRKRLEELFGFDYQLEMYKPVAKRRWGYFALPILVGDRFVGKLDATTDRKAGLLRVNAIHEDESFTPAMSEQVDAEIADLARWLSVERD